MEKIDSAKAARVWQRVKAETPGSSWERAEAPAMCREEGLPELIAGEWAAAEVYLQLSRKLRGRHSALLRQLAQQEQSHCACLKGLYTLIAGKMPAVKAVTPSEGELFSTLRRCYGQTLQRAARYDERSSEPEYGQVFAGLARQEREHCQRLLEILGELK